MLPVAVVSAMRCIGSMVGLKVAAYEWAVVVNCRIGYLTKTRIQRKSLVVYCSVDGRPLLMLKKIGVVSEGLNPLM
ncbi:hypothetical protein [uncultured Porticoccus sp.]|uniref:hypothetical protein n=1 Tax=uncultured Porticoccus sp. TaxID=1256050 RepID=UPI0026319BF6|nr:hypothetical protein [uncultured Porticoccus sp.]